VEEKAIPRNHCVNVGIEAKKEGQKEGGRGRERERRERGKERVKTT
jgi:hypothetical protein